jgi:hypothetical protein
MSAWLLVTVIVVATAVVIGALIYLRGNPPLGSLGRTGSTWLEHSEDRPPEERPDEDARDHPIPRRPLRVRWPRT